MKIFNLEFYFDGGTAEVDTDEGKFFVDRRLSSESCAISSKYPGEGEPLPAQRALAHQLMGALVEYDGEYKAAADILRADLHRKFD